MFEAGQILKILAKPLAKFGAATNQCFVKPQKSVLPGHGVHLPIVRAIRT
jgi:hypothetical protein